MNLFFKRLVDLLFSLTGLIVLLPFFIFIALLIIITSGFPIFYFQNRVGKGGKDFSLLKFRTMRKNSDKLGLLTVGGKDPRITTIGFYLRKYKLDELPQLINVLLGTMSIVGPRPEVRKYVDLYNLEQQKILFVKPGITDYASLEYFSENDLLAKSTNPEKTYLEEIMPAKLELNKKYILEMSLIIDFKIIFKTFFKIFRQS